MMKPTVALLLALLCAILVMSHSVGGQDTIPGASDPEPPEAKSEIKVETNEKDGTVDANTEDVMDLDEPKSADVDGTTETQTKSGGEGTSGKVEGSNDSDASSAKAESGDEQSTSSADSSSQSTVSSTPTSTATVPEPTNPLVDIFGPKLLKLEINEAGTQATIQEELTADALKGKSVVGIYFSADWCGPCRQFTPDLIKFYDRINARRRQKDDFEIIWVSRCRDNHSFGQYFTKMGSWYALPTELAHGQYGEALSKKYGVRGIPHLVLLDGESGSIITTDARNKIPQDMTGIAFPWRSPWANAYRLLPKTVRYMIRSQLQSFKASLISKAKAMVGIKPAAAAATTTAKASA